LEPTFFTMATLCSRIAIDFRRESQQNAGALATVGYGTALAPVRTAIRQGKRIEVVATETRPKLQGARLTAFELKQDKIPVTLITDTMVGHVMQNRMVSKVIVGADRILATGHVINKIGTLAVAILANHFRIPFYAAAPHSSFDLKAMPDQVVIEERDPREIAFVGDYRIAPKGVQTLNPAFDITEPELITGIITNLGVIHQPLEENIMRLL